MKISGKVAKPGAIASRPATSVQGALQSGFVAAIEEIAATHAATVESSAMWKSAGSAIRYTNYISPLMLGIISQPGTKADLAQRRQELDFLISSTEAATDALLPMIAKMGGNLSKYDREELMAIMAGFLGPIWEKSPDRAHEAVTGFIESITQAVTDPEFARRHAVTAQRMIDGDVGVFKSADTPETMVNRIAMSMQLASVRMHEAAIDRRLENPVSGAIFQWGRPKGDVAHALSVRFDQAMRHVLETRPLASGFSNNQRAALIQTFIRHASNVMAAEYVQRARAAVRWVREVKETDPIEWKRRIDAVDLTFPAVLEELGQMAEEALVAMLPAELIEEEQDVTESSSPSA